LVNKVTDFRGEGSRAPCLGSQKPRHKRGRGILEEICTKPPQENCCWVNEKEPTEGEGKKGFVIKG